MASNARRAGRPAWLKWVVIAGFGAFTVGAVIFVVTTSFGAVAGEEFSPQLFQRREFIYFELPLFRVQVWPITRTDQTGPTEFYVTTNKLAPFDSPKTTQQAEKSEKADDTKATGKAAPRWDLVELRRGGVLVSRSDAQILCNYLDANDEAGASVWVTWSKEHPKLAAVVWPVIAKLAREQLYILIPDVFDAAEAASDPQQLQQQLDQLLAKNYELLARRAEQLNRPKQALQLRQLSPAP